MSDGDDCMSVEQVDEIIDDLDVLIGQRVDQNREREDPDADVGGEADA